jgi:hypothetical protein
VWRQALAGPAADFFADATGIIVVLVPELSGLSPLADQRPLTSATAPSTWSRSREAGFLVSVSSRAVPRCRSPPTPGCYSGSPPGNAQSGPISRPGGNRTSSPSRRPPPPPLTDDQPGYPLYILGVVRQKLPRPPWPDRELTEDEVPMSRFRRRLRSTHCWQRICRSVSITGPRPQIRSVWPSTSCRFLASSSTRNPLTFILMFSEPAVPGWQRYVPSSDSFKCASQPPWQSLHACFAIPVKRTERKLIG